MEQNARVRSSRAEKETTSMSAAKDKTRGTGNEVAGKMKQAAGAATGNESLRA
jgi:hypothetical protein